MNRRPMKIPGPEHPITVGRNPNRVVVRAAGRAIADTRESFTLEEAGYPPVQYVPRQDVDMTLLSRSGTRTYCPYKGEAAYFTIEAGAAALLDAVWTYEEPYESVAAIKDHLAFYLDRVDAIEKYPADAGPSRTPS